MGLSRGFARMGGTLLSIAPGVRDFGKTARICRFGTMALAGLALLGWVSRSPALASLGDGLATMKPNTALCFIAASLAQSLLSKPAGAAFRRPRVALALLGVVASLSLLTIAEYVFGLDLLFDRWLIPGELASGRMGLNTAGAFILATLSLALLLRDSERAASAGHWLALASVWIAAVSFLGYLHSLRGPGTVSSHTQMSIPTALAFLFLSAGTLFVRPDRGLMKLATSPYAGGIALRRTLPAVVAVPLLLAWAVMEGSRAGWYPPELDLPLLAAFTMAILSFLLVAVVLPLERNDAERARIADSLERSRAEYRDLFENVPAAVFQMTTGGRFRNVNRALVELLGFESRDQVVALRSMAEVGLQALPTPVNTSAGPGSRNVEIELKRRDDTLLTALANVRVVKGEGERPLYYEGTLTDISDRKRLEEQLRQTQKMEAIGRLAGGVAHDFNNMLTAIIGYAQILKEEFPEKGVAAENVDEILHAGRRAASLTRQLLAFSRQQVLEPEVLDPGEVLDSILPMLRRIIGEDITLQLRLGTDLDRVTADRGQLEQVVMNLVINARDAMPHGGTVIIEVDNVVLDGQYAASHVDVREGRYVLLAVTDTGVGMDEATRAHIFEPFFTTKGKGRGTGLGLATVHGIVKQVGGSVWVYSEPGRGSTFKVYLPRTEEGGSDVKTGEREPTRATGNETVLVVEDEAPVRALISRILKRAGYSVLEAGDPQEAVVLSREHAAKLDLVITDIVMQSGSGPELIGQLRQESAELPALYISGYANTAIVENGKLGSDLPFLQKPFSADALLKKVRQVLDSRR